MSDANQPIEDSVTIPVVEEYIDYDVQRKETGKVRITKQVREEVVDVDESTTYERGRSGVLSEYLRGPDASFRSAVGIAQTSQWHPEDV